MPAVNQAKKNIITRVSLELVDVLGRQVVPLGRRIARCQDEPCVVGGDPMPSGVFMIMETDLAVFRARKTSTGLDERRLTHDVLARVEAALALVLIRAGSTSSREVVAGASGAPTIVFLIVVLRT